MKTNKKRRFWTVLCIILGVILALLLALTIAVNAILNQIPRYDPVEETISEEEIQQIIEETDPPEVLAGLEEIPVEEVIMPEPAEVIEKPDYIYNILLIGQDARPGEGRQRSDSMILCTINKQNKAITLTSFMRDLYVNIPGHGGDKLNAAYAYGGMDLLSQTMKENFGVQVDATVEVDFSGFKKVVNALGGIEIHLTAAEVDYMMSADWDGLSTDGWTLTPGVNLLNGDQALAYSRIRAIGYDFERTERQRRVISAILAKCKGMDIAQTNSLLWELLPLVATDMSNSQITNYARELLPLLSGNTVTTQRIPIEGSYTVTYVGPLDVVLADTEINRQFLIETLMPK